MTLCLHCNKEFVKASGVQKYCTRECLREASNRDRKGPLRSVKCIGCDTEFSTTNASKTYCGSECRWKHLNSLRPTSKTDIRFCVVCSKEFQPMQKTGPGRTWCSEACKHVMNGNPERLKRFLATEGPDEAKILAAREYRRNFGLKKTFGLTVAEYDAMHEAQNGLCFICKRPERARNNFDTSPRKLAVDHCHGSGKIRGLLCTMCNQGLGQFEDNPRFLQAAIEYLKFHGAKNGYEETNDDRPQTQDQNEGSSGVGEHERA
jgi:predicted nucleic acid-binding Zn ribbon protein